MGIAQAKTIDEILNVIETSLLAPIQGLLTILALLLFLYGVIEFIAGASSEEARTTGKNHMIWGLLGLVIIGAYMAIIVILKNFFGVK